MYLSAYVTATVVMSCTLAFAQEPSNQELARRLADGPSRADAVSQVLASGNDKTSLLLSWILKPPAQVDEYQLYIGLADIFGRMQTKEAIPFLIKNISLSRTNRANTWLKTAEVIENEMPAAAALVRIGLPASRAIMRAFVLDAPMRPEDRLPLIFVVSRIRDPEARAFLSSVLGEANLERYWAEDGLKSLSGKP